MTITENSTAYSAVYSTVNSTLYNAVNRTVNGTDDTGHLAMNSTFNGTDSTGHLAMNTTLSSTDSPDHLILGYDLGICTSGTLKKYIITSITLACLSVISQTIVSVLCILEKRYDKSGNVLILAYSLCNAIFVTFYTLTFILQEVSYCGWIYLSNAKCKGIWWIRHFSYMSSNFSLAFSVYETNPLIDARVRNDKVKRFIFLVILVFIQIGLFTSHYLVLGYYVREQTEYNNETIFTGRCSVDNRHTQSLQVVDFLIGTVAPLFVVFANICYCFFKKVQEASSKENLILPEGESKRRQMEKKISSRMILIKKIIKYAQNLSFWSILAFLSLFLLVPHRLLEFVLFLQNGNVYWLTIGLNNSSFLRENTWRVLLVIIILAPMFYSIFILPSYCFLTEQGRSYFKCAVRKQKQERSDSRQLRRKQPIRVHSTSSDGTLARCYSINDG